MGSPYNTSRLRRSQTLDLLTMRQLVQAGLATTSTLTPSVAHLASALPCSAIIGTFLAIKSRRSMPYRKQPQRGKYTQSVLMAVSLWLLSSLRRVGKSDVLQLNEKKVLETQESMSPLPWDKQLQQHYEGRTGSLGNPPRSITTCAP